MANLATVPDVKTFDVSGVAPALSYLAKLPSRYVRIFGSTSLEDQHRNARRAAWIAGGLGAALLFIPFGFSTILASVQCIVAGLLLYRAYRLGKAARHLWILSCWCHANYPSVAQAFASHVVAPVPIVRAWPKGPVGGFGLALVLAMRFFGVGFLLGGVVLSMPALLLIAGIPGLLVSTGLDATIQFVIGFLSGVSGADQNLGEATQVGAGLGRLMGAILMYGIGSWLLNRARRIATVLRMPEVEDLLRRDGRPAVLYLRAFRDDKLEVADTRSFLPQTAIRFEEHIMDGLRRCGPPIAIGRPQEVFPSAGAAREYVSDAGWQDLVLKRAQSAQLVVIIAGETEGLAWELEQCIRGGVSPKVIVLLPPGARADRAGRLKFVFDYFPLAQEKLSDITAGDGRKKLIGLSRSRSGECLALMSSSTHAEDYVAAAVITDLLLNPEGSSRRPEVLGQG